ncbi:MAG: hypothetical protein AAB177_01235 [Nitrospirota bacterium]|jgi:hypothetical protein
MKQHTFCLSPKVAGMALALFGLSAVLGLGSIGEAQAGQQALFQSFAPADRVGTGDHAIRVNRGTTERKCPRSVDGCEKPQSCKPGILVCRVDVDPMLKQ